MNNNTLPSEKLERAIGYKFNNKELLKEALTHSSYSNECRSKGVTAQCNERLEFLGDSVLSIVTSRYLFENMSDRQEGDMTKIRAAVVCEKALSKFAREVGLGSYIYLGRGEDLNRGRERASILADAFEALLAAIYLDSAEAAQFLISNKAIAGKYKINVDKIELLAEHGYFRPTMGNLGMPYSHRVPLLLPEEENSFDTKL